MGVREDIVATCLELQRLGLVQGTSGNVSARGDDGILVTPSGVPYPALRPEMIQRVPLAGEPEAGELRATSEWRFHQAVMAARPDVAAVVHTHAPYATAVAMQRRAIPACHYMVAAFGGDDVPLVEYSVFGGEALAADVGQAMSERLGCLLANHGAITAGETLERAVWRMQELEHLARVYLLSQIGGAPVILSGDEMAEVKVAFEGYGPAKPL